MNGACNVKLFLAQPSGALRRGHKVKYHFISITKSILKIFIPLCVFSQMKDTKHIRQDFQSIPGSCPRGGTSGRWDAQGVKKNSNMIMWYIKSTEMTSRTECK